MADAELAIGGSQHERLVLRIVGAWHDASAPAPYDRWLDAEVSIHAGPLRSHGCRLVSAGRLLP